MSKFAQVTHGRYIIKVGPIAGAFAAQAFLGARRIGDRQEGGTTEDALERAKAMLDAREAEIAQGRGVDGTPSALEYAEAFSRLGRLPQSYEAMLDAHVHAPAYRITATQLAEAGGYENFNAANLHYGKLGQMLAKELNYNPKRREDGTVIWTATLATWSEWSDEDREDEGQFQWELRPQVVEALHLQSQP